MIWSLFHIKKGASISQMAILGAKARPWAEPCDFHRVPNIWDNPMNNTYHPKAFFLDDSLRCTRKNSTKPRTLLFLDGCLGVSQGAYP